MVLFLMGCSKDKQLCDTIQNKEENSGVYYFYFRTNYYNNPQMNQIGGAGINSQYASGKVSEEVYNQYDIGDQYCY